MIICKECLGEIAEIKEGESGGAGKESVRELKFCPYCGAALDATGEEADSLQHEEEEPEQIEEENTEQKQEDVQDTNQAEQHSETDVTKLEEKEAKKDVQEQKNTKIKTDAPTENEKILALFSYVWILVFIPLIVGRKSPYVKFHADQGVILLVSQLAYWAAYVIFTALIFLISYKLAFIVIFFGAVGLGFFVLIILGMVNAAKGRTEKLPIIGNIA